MGELGVAYQTAWTMAHKLRHGLNEDPARPLRGFLEADETFIGGRGDATSRGRSTASPDKSLVVAVVEKVRVPKKTTGWTATYSARRRMRHHHLRSAKDRHPARRRPPCPPASRSGCAACSSWIGRQSNIAPARSV